MESNFNSLSDLIYFNMNTHEIEEPDMLNFYGPNSIILYTGLSYGNLKKLQNNQHKGVLIAHEYFELAQDTKQADVVVEIEYNTEGLFDVLHPYAYKYISNYIESKKLKKQDITDEQIINAILSQPNYNGVRIARIKTTNKLYSKTEMCYHDTIIFYFLNPASIQIKSITKLN